MSAGGAPSCLAGVTERAIGSTSGDFTVQFVCVRKLLQNRVVLGRLEEAEGAAEEGIDQGAGVHDVEIERNELTAEMELGIVIERSALISAQTLTHCPVNDVAKGLKIKIELERNFVIEAEAFVVNRVPGNEAQAERDDFS